jgi:PHD/YefM family antitoxin component YafN of YafNO toxin-antitoxin module
MSATQLLKQYVPISQFNKGKASQIFGDLRKVRKMVVMKNNQPEAVILSVEEYERILSRRDLVYKLNPKHVKAALLTMQAEMRGMAEKAGIESDEDVVNLIRDLRYGWRDK